MYEENPYAAPESVSGFAPSVAPSGYPPDRFYVDGNLIMCGTPVALPAVCVITGETEDIVLISLVNSLVMLVLGQRPIKAVRHENGVKFWLKGFRQPFFDHLRVMYANAG